MQSEAINKAYYLGAKLAFRDYNSSPPAVLNQHKPNHNLRLRPENVLNSEARPDKDIAIASDATGQPSTFENVNNQLFNMSSATQS